MTPVDKNGTPLEVGQKVRFRLKNTEYPAVVLNVYPEMKCPFGGCAVLIEVEGDPETHWSHYLDVVE